MQEEIFKPYETLRELLQSQQAALEQCEFQKLAALAPQIESYCRKVTEFSSTLETLKPPQIESAKAQVMRLQEQVNASFEAWGSYHRQLKAHRDQVRSSRRFVHQARLKHKARGPRISHSA